MARGRARAPGHRAVHQARLPEPHPGQERAAGPQWLTVPVVTKGRYDQATRDVQIDESARWRQVHLRTLQQHAGQGPASRRAARRSSEPIYAQDGGTRLVELNVALIRAVVERLGIGTRLVLASELDLTGSSTRADDEPDQGRGGRRLPLGSDRPHVPGAGAVQPRPAWPALPRVRPVRVPAAVRGVRARPELLRLPRQLRVHAVVGRVHRPRSAPAYQRFCRAVRRTSSLCHRMPSVPAEPAAGAGDVAAPPRAPHPGPGAMCPNSVTSMTWNGRSRRSSGRRATRSNTGYSWQVPGAEADRLAERQRAVVSPARPASQLRQVTGFAHCR